MSIDEAGEGFSTEEIAAGDALFARAWQFLKSVPALEFLPDSEKVEIAFAGRSNVGKSSLINALVNQHGLARTSNTPGRTQELNFFETPGVPLFLVDMPGYGFARAPKASVDRWTALVKTYLRGRPSLVRTFLLIDARHGLKAPDLQVMKLMDIAAVSYRVVLTKIDKIKPTELARVMQTTLAALVRHPAAYPALIATSSETGDGIADLRAEIARQITLRGSA
jgi:GTP-binding protein